MAGAAKTVYVELIARTKKFNSGLKKADKTLSKTRKGVAAVSAAILAVGAVAIRALVKELSELSKELDNMAKTSKGLGVSFEFLEDMQFVFKRLGGEAGPAQMVKLIGKLGDAATGASQGLMTYVREFENLGINTEEFLKLKPEAQLLALHIAYGKSAKSTQDMASMSLILGRSFKKNISVFAESTDEFVRLIELRRDLGGLSAESGKLAETFEDLKVNISQVTRDLKDEVFKQFAPTMIAMTAATEAFWKDLNRTGNAAEFVNGAMKVFATVMGAAAVAAIAVGIATFPVLGIFLLATAAITGLVLGLGTLITRWDELKTSVVDFFKSYNTMSRDFWEGFGGEVLQVLGFGDAGSAANRAGAGPATIPRPPVSTGDVTTQTIINNNYAPGQTPAQQRAEAKRQEQAALAGKRR